MWTAAIVLGCALDLLGRSANRFHPIDLIEAPPVSVSRNAEAYVTHEPPTIHLVTSAAVFREAMRSPVRCGERPALAKLASIIAHEEWHLRHGADEEGAYSTQLTTLVWLGFDEQSAVYGTVKKAMLHVLRLSATRGKVVDATPRRPPS